MTMAVNMPSFTFKPVDLFHNHYIVFDSMFRKVGTLDHVGNFWVLSTLKGDFQYTALSRDKAIEFWFKVNSHAH